MVLLRPFRVPSKKRTGNVSLPDSPRPTPDLLFASKGIVIRLYLSGDLHPFGALLLLFLQWRALLNGIHTVALDLGDDLIAVLVTPVLRLCLCTETEGEGTLLGVLKGEDGAALWGSAAGADDVCRGVRVGVGGADSEGATVLERAADGEDDAQGHGGREYSGHAGDDRANGVDLARRLDDEPEEHVDHVHEPDGGVEIEAVAEHELPVRDLLNLERLQRALDGENEGGGVEEGRGEPVDADPVVLGRGDAALTFLEWSN